MSKLSRVTPLGAAAVALGLSLAAPGIAAAEDSAPGSSPSSAASSADSEARQTQASPGRRPTRELRAPKTVSSQSSPESTLSAPASPTSADRRPAARTGSGPLQDRAAATTNLTRGSSSRAANQPTARAENSTDRLDAARRTAGIPARPETAGPETARPETADFATPRAATVPDEAPTPTIAQTSSAPTTFASASRGATNTDALRAPRAAASASATDLLSGLLSPIQGLIEGVALLVRRTFFNQAPSVSPVQITGQSEGPITGNIGARDPEGDRILYSLTSNARYGSVVLDATGGYIYTPGQDFTGTDTFTVAAADPGFHINLLDLFRPPSTAASVVVRQGVAAAGSLLQFQFYYGSGAQFWSPAARSSLESAATALASYIVVDAPVIVTFEVTGEFSLLSSTLATAGSDFISSDPGFLPTVVQNKILTGVDSNGAEADGEINWNFAQNWAFGDSVAYGQYDLESVALHELTHTLGFLSYVDAPGANTGLSWTVFDSFLVNADGTKVIGNDYAWKNTYTPNLTGANGGLYFAGADAVAAYGNLVPIYTPGTWAPGSSISHLNDRVFGVSRTLMTAQVGSGRGIRVLSPIELGVLADLGYTVTPQPSGAMLAFIGVFFLRRTRRR